MANSAYEINTFLGGNITAKASLESYNTDMLKKYIYTSYDNTTEANKPILQKNIAKLAENVSCGDIQYAEWITRKFMGKLKKVAEEDKDQFAFVFLHKNISKEEGIDKKKPGKRPVAGFLIDKRQDKEFNKTKAPNPKRQIPQPKMCENEKTGVPIVWKSDGDKKLKINGDEKLKKKFCFTGAFKRPVFGQHLLIHLLSLGVKQTNVLFKFYGDEQYLNFGRALKMDQIILSYKLEDFLLEQIPMRLDKLWIDVPGFFEYIRVPKDNEATRNLIMIPKIERFYAENPRLVTSEVRRTLRDMSCCYDEVLRSTGVLFTMEKLPELAVYSNSLVYQTKSL